MRIVHTRKRVFEKGDFAFSNKMALLVWILSILKWKEFNNEVVLYCDEPTLNDIKEFGFEGLYDEINDTLLDDELVCNGIDFYCYWAMPKLLVLRYETLDLGNEVVIADQDVVPMLDFSIMWECSDVVVWSNKEFIEFKKTIYPKIRDLSLPKEYTLPEWFTGNAKPLNTGILYIKDKNVVDLFTSEAKMMATDNHNEKHNSNTITMCNVEQRLLGELVEYLNLSVSVVQPVDQGLFNYNGFHTHGYKSIINNDNGLLWHLNLLLLIRQKDIDMFAKLVEHPLFKEEKDYLTKYGANCDLINELSIYY